LANLRYRNSSAGTVVYQQSLARDGVGRIGSFSELIGGVNSSYSYRYEDLSDRLYARLSGTDTTARYAYDGNDNRIAVITASGADSATYDAQDRLLSFGHVASGYTRYTYAPNGELAQRVSPTLTSTYVYDEVGNLVSVTLLAPGNGAHHDPGDEIRYRVDGQSRRVAKLYNGVVQKQWLYGGALGPVAELNAAGSVVSRFVYGSRANVPDYMVSGGVTYRLVSDHLGSVRLVVNASSGAIAQRMDYDAWGNVIADTNPGFQPFAFAGGLYDPDTRLTRFGARDYDASVGRWTTKDPIRFAGGSANLYAYAADDPVNLIDPTGTDANDDLNGIAGAADGLSCGLASKIRDKYFGYNNIDRKSKEYRQGRNDGKAILVAAATQLGVGLLAVAADGLFAGTAAATMFGEGTLGAAAAKTLQSGGNTIKAATADGVPPDLRTTDYGRIPHDEDAA
jgi:RHS repeat-associated protein